MQVHERPQAALLLVRQGVKNAFSCMQNHALYACTRSLTPASQEKGCFWGEGLGARDGSGRDYPIIARPEMASYAAFLPVCVFVMWLPQILIAKSPLRF